jgi:hypothetical protein
MFERMLPEIPLRKLSMFGRGKIANVTPSMIETLVDVLNGKPCTDPGLSRFFG